MEAATGVPCEPGAAQAAARQPHASDDMSALVPIEEQRPHSAASPHILRRPSFGVGAAQRAALGGSATQGRQPPKAVLGSFELFACVPSPGGLPPLDNPKGAPPARAGRAFGGAGGSSPPGEGARANCSKMLQTAQSCLRQLLSLSCWPFGAAPTPRPCTTSCTSLRSEWGLLSAHIPPPDCLSIRCHHRLALARALASL
eukprot:11526389-Alexandrium_andersonii.AAC.1